MSLRDVPYKWMYISGVDNLVSDFYIPSLCQSVLYRRRTGYFNSRALAMSARGLSGLLKNEGKMQLLCSVQLEAEEEEVLRDPVKYVQRQSESVAEALSKPYDEVEKKRLALLAELLARGKLEIRIGVMRKGIYHEKAGIFTDADGNVVAFNGSGNETPGGWVHNMESFHAYRSWEEMHHIDPEIKTFEMLWEGRHPTTTVVPLPVAVSQRLLEFRNYFREGHDDPIDPTDIEPELRKEQTWEWTPGLAYVFEARRLWNHEDFAFGEAAVTPFEHQDYIASTVLDAWPPRTMLCDEVGLGKTIEAGLIIKGFLASGRIDRLLILAPKNALIQWQQEMLSKFHMEVWRLEGDSIYGPTLGPGETPERRPVDAANPFRSHPYLIVGSQLVRRDNRQEQLLGVDYDLVVLDEAHHARARGPSGRREANKLLNALEGLQYRTQGMLLLSATPIQLDRRELWDLLNVLELPGLWQDEDKFDAFFNALNKEPTEWGFLFRMTKSSLEAWGQDEVGLRLIKQQYPNVNVYRLMHVLKEEDTAAAAQLGPEEQDVLRLLIYRNSPIRRMVFRNTRELLREYRSKGSFTGKIADRQTEKLTIELKGSKDDTRSELGLYCKIQQYVKEYYGKYKDVRKGLGFLMETYRKRLTSSFYAIEKSLSRRHAKLGKALDENNFALLFEGIDEDELLDASPGMLDMTSERFASLFNEREIKALRKVVEQEHQYLEDFIRDLRDLPTDTKFEVFRTKLDRLLGAGTRQVIVFSQFKDTVDYLLGQFRPFYGERLGSYTGQGGLFWDGSKWVECTKQRLKEKFTDPNDPLSILFCTDAASESINLQSCDTIFNYDIPWNPMRIEQRIGRVDRIGQESPIVKVFTLSYKDTVEDKAFERCLERIGYFTSTLGHLQPILQATERAIRKATLGEDEKSIDKIIEEEFEVAKVEENLRIWELINRYEPTLPKLAERVPMSHEQLESEISNPLQERGWKKEGRVWIKDDKRITFDPAAMDDEAETATLVTPTSTLSEYFGNLPPIPDTITKNGMMVTIVRAEGYTGLALHCDGGFRLVDKYVDIVEGGSGRLYKTIEEVEKGLVATIQKRRRQSLETQLRMWRNREKSWIIKVTMYLERLFEWRMARAKSGAGSLIGFSDSSISGDWYKYLADTERKTLKTLSELVDFEPDIQQSDTKSKKRSKQSPRDASQEEDQINQIGRIRGEIEKLETLLTTCK